MRAEGTPVPIPNTTVKIRAADGTMLETAWESRWPPEQKKKCSTVEGRKGRDTQVPTHLENRIYDNLAEHELQAEKRKFVHTKNRKPQK